MAIFKATKRERVARDPQFKLALAVGCLVFLASATLSLLRFYTFGNDNFDIAFYTRVVWGMANGDRIHPILGAHDLGLHFMPVMWVFVPFSHFLPIPETLLLVQSFALGAVAPLLYRLGLRTSGRPSAGLALAAAWLLHPSTLHLGSQEFHPGALALPFLIAALDALQARRHLLGLLLLLIASSTREDASLVAAGSGMALLFSPGQRRFGAALAVCGAAWFSAYCLAIQPAYLPQDGSIDAHFPGMGHSADQVGAFLLFHPEMLIERLFSKTDILYIAALALVLAGLPLLGPKWLLAAAPPLLINMLSDFPGVTRLSSHYVTLALPGLFMAAATGLSRALSWSRATRLSIPVVISALILAVCVSHAMWGATPLSLEWSEEPYVRNRDEGILSWYARGIAKRPDLSVSAPSEALNHLAERRHLYATAFDHPKPDVAILDLRERQWVSLSPDRFDSPMESESQRLDADPAFGTWRMNPPYRALWRGLPGGKERLASVSVRELPETAAPQEGGWPGVVSLVGLEARLGRERESLSGKYRKRIALRTTFYWRADGPLPPGLIVKTVVRGTTKTHIRYFLPTWGVRDTGTWKPGEIIRDEQWMVSPGGWPLSELSAEIQLVRRGGSPYPPGASPIRLRW